MAGWHQEWIQTRDKFKKRVLVLAPEIKLDDDGELVKLLETMQTYRDQYDQSPNDLEKRKLALARVQGYIKIFEPKAKAFCMAVQAKMVKAPNKQVMSELDILRKQADALTFTIKGYVKVWEANAQKLGGLETAALQLRSAADGAAKRARLFLAQVKAKPKGKLWNDGITKASRDLAQQIGNIDILRAKALHVPGVPPGPGKPHYEELKRWRDGKITFAVEAGWNDMKAEWERFMKAVQAVENWLKTA